MLKALDNERDTSTIETMKQVLRSSNFSTDLKDWDEHLPSAENVRSSAPFGCD